MNIDKLSSFKQLKVILVVSIFFLIHSTIFYAIYSIENKNEIHHLKDLSIQSIEQQEMIINSNLENIKSDLSLLSNTNLIKNYLTDNKKYDDFLKDRLKTFIMKKNIYDQIRILDLKGNEKVRINLLNNGAEVIDTKNLQNKKDRYYFKESMKLNKNDIYVSLFDLNIEHKKIENPIKPMIRFATPIYLNNEKKGILIFNYLGTNLLHQLTTSFKFFKADISLLNKDGYWLLNKDKNKEWGFMYPDKKDINIKNEYQEEWNTISNTNKGDFVNQNGFFCFTTIKTYENDSWKILLTIHTNVLDEIKENNIKTLFPIFIAILIIGIIFIYFYFLLIVKQKISEEKLSLMSLVFKYSKEGIIITDNHSNILEVNKSFVTTTGYSLNEIIGQNPRILQSGWSSEDFYQNMWKKIEDNDYFETEITNRKKNGEIYLEWLRVYKIKNQKNEITNFVGIFSDITKQKETENEIYRLAHYDTLTKLPNRQLFNITLSEVLENSKQENNGTKVALLFIDLDNFKYINDAFGHYIGDKFLQKVAYRIESVVNRKEMTSRLGGDEFVVIINNFENNHYIQNIAKNIITSLSKPFNIVKNEDIFTSASIGISIYPDDANTEDELIKHADIAMYIAKKNGKNTYQIFDKNLEGNSQERFSIETMLHKAVENKEFVLHYQAQVDTITNKIVGFEALIRWNSETRGLVSPVLFIPIAEETGLIHNIGDWIIDESFSMLKRVQDLGYMIDASINLSSIQLKNSTIVNKISSALNNHKINPKHIKLEITESVLMENIDEYLLTLNKLSGLGVKISIDDFGTGYSSLNYLKRLPIDELKIDKSFIQDILNDKNDSQIVSAIVSIAKALELKVVAEGVERIEEVEILKNLKCDKIQGYYYSKPLEEEKFINLLENFLV